MGQANKRGPLTQRQDQAIAAKVVAQSPGSAALPTHQETKSLIADQLEVFMMNAYPDVRTLKLKQ